MDNKFDKLKDINHRDLLIYKEKIPASKIHYTVTENKDLPNIRNTIDKNWNLLKIDGKLSTIIQWTTSN